MRGLIGRFLEHARIYHFGNDGADDYLIASADWRSRNLRRRVEVVVPVADAACRRRLDAVLARELADPSAWELAATADTTRSATLPVGDPATAQAQAMAGDSAGRGGGMEQVRHAGRRAAASLILWLLAPALARRSRRRGRGGRTGHHRRARRALSGRRTAHIFLRPSLSRLWTTPIRVPVLDLDRFAGGLTPTERGGGKQTRSLRFAAADGREYQFRSLDKDPSPLLPPELRQTVAQGIFQDQISAGHPGAALVVSPILTAAGVLHSEPQLALMPDSPPLGQFRADFGGLLGTIEERPTDHGPGFAGADKIIATDELFERLEQHPEERVDARAYLTHGWSTWCWAIGTGTRTSGAGRVWAKATAFPGSPIPRDRDQAFANYDGLLLGLARLSAPQLVKFSGSYPSIVGLTWNARVVDRRFLSGLEWGTWDSVADRPQGAASPTRSSMARCGGCRRSCRSGTPPGWRRRSSSDASSSLRKPASSTGCSPREVEVMGSDQADHVVVDHQGSRQLELTISPAKGGGPTYRRRFDRDDTREVRLYLHGDDDAVVIRGAGGGAPLLRVIGGGGNDRVTDSSSAGRTRFYDARGTNEVGGLHRVPLDARPYQDFSLSDSTPYPRRDWGGFWRFRPWVDLGARCGAVLRRRRRAAQLRLPEAALCLEARAPRRLRDRRRPVPSRVPG